MLILGIIIILAAASVAHAESARRREYRVEVSLDGKGITFAFEGGNG